MQSLRGDTSLAPQDRREKMRGIMQDSKSKIMDVIVEGVSMSVTQRSEFAAVIQRNGGKIDGLLKTLREKTASQ